MAAKNTTSPSARQGNWMADRTGSAVTGSRPNETAAAAADNQNHAEDGRAAAPSKATQAAAWNTRSRFATGSQRQMNQWDG